MASISRPQSSAAPRSPLSTTGYTSPIKYASSTHYAPNQLHSDPNAVFASESRKFLSSRKGERPYMEDQQRHRSGSYSAPTTATSSALPESHYHRALPPPLPNRMNPLQNGGSGRSQQQLLAAEIGRSSTALPRPHRQHEEVSSPKGIYPSHMLPPSSSLRTKPSSTMAPFSGYRDPSSSYQHDPSFEDPYASHRYRSPVYSPPPSSIASSTNSASSPPSSQPQSPTRSVHSVSHSHSHGRTHSLSANAYATDYAGNSSKLLPMRGVPSKRHTQQYPSSHSHSGLGAVGPALAQNIPPVLPRPPSVKGTSSSSGLGRSGSLGRNGSVRKGEKTITDEEQAAYAALNTYR